MAKWVLNKQHFLNGITYNPETGIEDMFGVDIYKDIGYIQGGWEDSAITGMRNKNKWMIPDTEISDTASFMWFINTTTSDSSTIYKYNVDDRTIDNSASISTSQGIGGAVKLGAYIYTGGDYNCKDLGRITLSTLSNSATYSSFANNTDYREMIPFKDGVYACDGDEIVEISVNGTVTQAALKLTPGHQAVSLAPYGEYLAIGALCGKYNPSRGKPKGFYKSKLYFWDTTPLTDWDVDRSTKVDGRILKLINKKGVLYIVLQDRKDSCTLNYYNRTAIIPLKRITLKEGTDLVIPDNDAYDVKGDQIFMGIDNTGSYNARVLAYGQGDAETPIALTNPNVHSLAGGKTLSEINSVKWGTPNELYVSSIDSDDTSLVTVFKEANHHCGWRIITPNFSTGDKQTLTKFKVSFPPMTTGQSFAVSHKIDNTSTWTSWDTVNYAELTQSKDTYINTKILEFNTIQFQITKPAGVVFKIKSIEVDSENQDTL